MIGVSLTTTEFAYLIWFIKTSGKVGVSGVSMAKVNAIIQMANNLKIKGIIDYKDVQEILDKTDWGYAGEIILEGFKYKDFEIRNISNGKVILSVKNL